MTKIWAAAWAAMALAAGAPSAVAKPIPEGGVTIEDVQSWLSDSGYKAQIETSKEGEKYINSGSDGLKFSLYFYDCKQKRCAAVQFYLGFDKGPDTPDVEKINRWNRDKRYLKAYLDQEGDVAFEYDANVSPGGTWEAFEDDFNTFLTFLPDAKALVNW